MKKERILFAGLICIALVLGTVLVSCNVGGNFDNPAEFVGMNQKKAGGGAFDVPGGAGATPGATPPVVGACGCTGVADCDCIPDVLKEMFLDAADYAYLVLGTALIPSFDPDIHTFDDVWDAATTVGNETELEEFLDAVETMWDFLCGSLCDCCDAEKIEQFASDYLEAKYN